MPKLIRLYIVNVLIGFALAAIFVVLLLTLDIGGLRHLMLEVQGGWLGGVMLVLLNGVVFAGVQFAIAVMRVAESDDDTPSRGQALKSQMGDPLRVPVVLNRRR